MGSLHKSNSSNNNDDNDDNNGCNENNGSGGNGSNHDDCRISRSSTSSNDDEEDLRTSKQLALAGPIRPPSPGPRERLGVSASSGSGSSAAAIATHGSINNNNVEDHDLRTAKGLSLAGPSNPHPPSLIQRRRQRPAPTEADARTAKGLSLAGPSNPHPPSLIQHRRQRSAPTEADAATRIVNEYYDEDDDDEDENEDDSLSMQPGAHRIPGRLSAPRDVSAMNVTNTGSLIEESADTSTTTTINNENRNSSHQQQLPTTPPPTPTVAVAKVVEERELALQYCEEKLREIERRETQILQREQMMLSPVSLAATTATVPIPQLDGSQQQQNQSSQHPPPPVGLLSNSIPPTITTAAASAAAMTSATANTTQQQQHPPVVLAQSVTPIVDDDTIGNGQQPQRQHRKSKSSMLPTRLFNALRGSGTRRSSLSPKNNNNNNNNNNNTATTTATNIASTTSTDAATASILYPRISAAAAAAASNASIDHASPTTVLSPPAQLHTITSISDDDNNDTTVLNNNTQQQTMKQTVVWCWKETPSQMSKHNKNDVWGDGSEYWIKYNTSLNNEIEQAYNNYSNTLLLQPNGDDYLLKGLKGYKINFTSMHQTKIETKFEREIQRCIITTSINNNSNSVVPSSSRNNVDNNNTKMKTTTVVARSAKQIPTFGLIDNGTIVWCWKETSVRINDHPTENVFSKEYGWIRYEKEASCILERAYQSYPDITECVPLKGYKVVFVGDNNCNNSNTVSSVITQMKQIKLSTSYERDVLRFCMDDDDDGSATISSFSV